MKGWLPASKITVHQLSDRATSLHGEGRRFDPYMDYHFKDVLMPTVRYKSLTATYDKQTAKDLKDAHDINIEKELLDIMESLYKEQE